jgi:hypothetical protein
LLRVGQLGIPHELVLSPVLGVIYDDIDRTSFGRRKYSLDVRHETLTERSTHRITKLLKMRKIEKRSTQMKITQAATLSIIVLVTALISGSAYAMSCGGTTHTHSAQRMAEKYFSQMDANGDELVSEAEFKASAMTKFVQSFVALKPNAAGFVEKKAFLKMFVEAHSTDKPEA